MSRELRPYICRAAVVTLLGLLVLGAPAQRAQAQVDVGSHSSFVPLLWEIEGAGSTLYLYGSIHIAPPEVVPPPAVVREAFTRSSLLVTEVPITEDLDATLERALAPRMFFEDGRTLERAATPEQWAAVERWGREQGLPAEMLETMQPWALELLATRGSAVPPGFSSEHGLDTYFADKATARAMETRALEAVDDQIEVLAGGTLREQLASLMATITRTDPLTDTLELYHAWRAGNVEKLRAMVAEGLEGPASDSYERLLTNRNQAWANRLQRLLETGTTPVFVVVGAAHLVGPASVQAILDTRGYSARRLLSPAHLAPAPARP